MRLKLPMSDLAWGNLVHDKVRLGVTLTGIVFAVVLIVVELGLFVGFTSATTGLIDNARADFWITAARVGYVEVGVPFSERKRYTVLRTPGVAQATGQSLPSPSEARFFRGGSVTCIQHPTCG